MNLSPAMPRFSYSFDSLIKVCTIGVCIVIAFLYFFQSYYRPLHQDEIEAIHCAWKLFNGERVYIDFFEHHHPFLYYLLVPVISVFGETMTTVLVCRMVILCMVALIVYVTYLMTVTIATQEIAVIAALFLSCFQLFFKSALDIRPDVPQLLFTMTSFYFFIQFLSSHRFSTLLVSALSLSFSFLFLQKAIFSIALCAIFMTVLLHQKKITLQHFTFFWVMFLMPIALYFGYLLFFGYFADYFFLNWILNMHFALPFKPYEHLRLTYMENSLLWSFFLLFALSTKKTFFNSAVWSYAIWMLMCYIFIFRTPYAHYLLPTLPFVAIIAAITVYELFHDKIIILYFFVLLTIFSGIDAQLKNCLDLYRTHPWREYSVAAYVLQNTTTDDYVYDGNTGFNLFRKDLDFFWFSNGPISGLASYQKIKAYTYDIYQLIARYKPKIIATNFLDRHHCVIEKNYVKTDFDTILIRKPNI